MQTLKKQGLVRIVATEAEAERWKALGYQPEEQPEPSDAEPTGKPGKGKPPAEGKEPQE